MIGIEVRLNGQLLCTAGQDDGDVFVWMHIVGWRLAGGMRPPSELRIEASKDFVDLGWPGAENLVPGDDVHIRVVESAVCDEPTRKPRPDADAEEAQERLTYEWLKRKYGR